jgi:FAD binding domain
MSTLETCGLRSSTAPAERTAIAKTCQLGNLPSAYIDVKAVKDVQAALAFVKRSKIPLAIKNSGHDHKGRSAGVGTLALWMDHVKQPMRIVKGFVPEGCSGSMGDVVTFSTGENFADLVKFTDGRGYTIVAGSSATVR